MTASASCSESQRRDEPFWRHESRQKPLWRTIRGFASFGAVTSMTPNERRASPERAASDVDIVTRMARGEKAALALLYDRFAPTLLALGTRMLSDRREAEDLMHDVFIEAWNAAASYDAARGSVATWLILRMRSRTLDRLRSAGRTRTILTDDPIPSSGESQIDPSTSPDRVAVLRALDALPAEQRAVIELGYFGGMSSSEIAEKVGISIGTVKSRTAAGLNKLRQRLGSTPGGRK